MRLVLLALVLPCAALAADPATAEAQATPVDMTQEEFKMFRHWQKAMADPRVEQMKESQKNPAIAKDAGFKLKEMLKAIEKGEAAGDLKAACIAQVSAAFAAAPMLAGRGAKVEVDTAEPHAVAYVQWNNENLGQLEEEASLAASITAKQCPILSTIQVWAQDKANPTTRVFQALISRSAASKINGERAKDFADTRYIRLFERVKNVAYGDAINEAGDPTHAGGGSAGGQK